MKDLLQNFIIVTSFKKGEIEVSFRNDSPDNLLNRLAAKLKEWTGYDWQIKSDKGFDLDHFFSEPDIQVIRAVFPEAKVSCIRTTSES
ncbi:hypothetical protein [Candidatus Liberibacter americanus]|uniref:hypothetical protein n=1 Tax=Candidatus Liberibacter americanus TaxID=309868 RepID=UPI0002C5FF45|nr:DNA polymerase III subunits gamma and tau [Candidatus Liberibacter americanus PW_SP]